MLQHWRSIYSYICYQTLRLCFVRPPCQCRAKYGVVEQAPAEASKDSNDSNKDENKSSAALSALGGYGSDSDSDSPENE